MKTWLEEHSRRNFCLKRRAFTVTQLLPSKHWVNAVFTVKFSAACLGSVRKSHKFRTATDADIRLKCASFFTNSRDRGHFRTPPSRRSTNERSITTADAADSGEESFWPVFPSCIWRLMNCTWTVRVLHVTSIICCAGLFAQFVLNFTAVF